MLAMDLLDEYGYVCIMRSRMYVRVDALIKLMPQSKVEQLITNDGMRRYNT